MANIDLSKKISAIVAATMMLVSTVPVLAEDNNTLNTDSYQDLITDLNPEQAAYGKCGENAAWYFDKLTGTLTIGGSGATYDFTDSEPGYLSYSDAITALSITDGITSIGYKCFAGLDKLSSAELAGSVEVIGEGAFEGCVALESISLTEGLKEIKNAAFSGCAVLKSISLPDSVVLVEEGAFSGCDALESVKLSSAMTEYSGFSGCKALKSIVMPDSITSMSGSAFSGCEGLESVVLSSAIEAIGENAFYGCTSLKSVTFSKNVKEIGAAAFDGCLSLTDVYYDGTRADMSAVNILTKTSDWGEALGNSELNANDFLVNATWHYADDDMVITSVALDQTTVEVSVGNTVGLVATAYSDETENPLAELAWSSSDESVATVDENGTVKGIAKGTATITVACGELSASCEVTVSPYSVREGYISFATSESEFVQNILDAGYEYDEPVTESTILDFLTSLQRTLYRTNRKDEITEDSYVSQTVSAAQTIIQTDKFKYLESALVATYPDSAQTLLEDGEITEEFEPLFDAVEDMVFEHDILDTYEKSSDITIAVTEIVNPEATQVQQLDDYTLPEYITTVSETGLTTKIKVDWTDVPDTTEYGTVDATGELILPTSYIMDEEKENEATAEIDISPISAEGECNEDVTWSLEKGTLTVSGNGAIDDYDEETPAPWDEVKAAVNKVVIEEGITSVGTNAFSGLENISNKTVELPETVETVSSGAFSGSTVESVVVSSTATTVAEDAFTTENLTVYAPSGSEAEKLVESTSTVIVSTDSDTPSIVSVEVLEEVAEDGTSTYKAKINSLSIEFATDDETDVAHMFRINFYSSDNSLISSQKIYSDTVEIDSSEVKYVSVLYWDGNTLQPMCKSRMTKVIR